MKSKPYTINPRMLQAEPMQRCKLHACRAACCLYGVWIDEHEWEQILAAAELIGPHMPAGWDDPSQWVDERRDSDEFAPSRRVIHSRVVRRKWHYGGTACVFLRPDYKCALQVAGQQAGLHPWHYKPFYCVLHPLDLDEQGRITVDETDALLAEEGSCLRPAVGLIPLKDTFEKELRYFLGDDAYEKL